MLRWAGGTRARADARAKRRPIQRATADGAPVVMPAAPRGGADPFALRAAAAATPASVAGYGANAGKRRKRSGTDRSRKDSLDVRALALPPDAGASGRQSRTSEARLQALRQTAAGRSRGERRHPAAHASAPRAVHSAPVSRLDNLPVDMAPPAAAATAHALAHPAVDVGVDFGLPIAEGAPAFDLDVTAPAAAASGSMVPYGGGSDFDVAFACDAGAIGEAFAVPAVAPGTVAPFNTHNFPPAPQAGPTGIPEPYASYGQAGFEHDPRWSF
eukprot:CAMPEP_0174827280 /NCGR_PEP_ID=MMETSP1114-20130205/607_1 /TAXON_ID=312471 /ORGANISM="Neobodo designis, Strain CCAP 1951/1" /LENGTH=271 /DNA_ID=CAMNT_0016060909 /DNA_START=70 /DNA_END=885 /DNA_ORIENTATION=-